MMENKKYRQLSWKNFKCGFCNENENKIYISYYVFKKIVL